ncbi:MAG TPA: MoaD/ThiS family protein [Nitrococcus sp.]|nr:MoaD/ThiS family protein [Nitrococcus sp.]
MRIEFYGVLQEAAGSEALDLPINTPSRVAHILEELAERIPALQSHLPRIACAVGDEVIPRSEMVTGDVPLVLLPPVSGG